MSQGVGKSSKIDKTTANNQDECSASFRIRAGNKPPTPSQNQQQRVPTIYGMPKLQAQTKVLPKLDHQLGMMMEEENDFEQKPRIDPSIRSLIKQKRKDIINKEVHTNKEETVIQSEQTPEKKQLIEEEKFSTHNKSRVSTAKSSVVDNSSSQSSLAQTPSYASLMFDPNGIMDDNSVLADLVKTNVQLLQKCLVSSNKAIFIAAIENLKNASNNFGPALNKHLPIVLQLVKKKQDLVATERIHDLKNILIVNGGEEAEKVVNLMGLK